MNYKETVNDDLGIGIGIGIDFSFEDDFTITPSGEMNNATDDGHENEEEQSMVDFDRQGQGRGGIRENCTPDQLSLLTAVVGEASIMSLRQQDLSSNNTDTPEESEHTHIHDTVSPTTSTSDGSSSNLSLAFSTICSSISSLFHSNPDATQNSALSESTSPLIHSTISNCNSASASTERSSTSMDCHDFGSEAFEEEEHEGPENFPRETFLNVARRLAAQDSLLPIATRGRTSTSSTMTSSESSNQSHMDTTESSPNLIEWWMDYTEEDWDNFAHKAREILQVLENQSNGNGNSRPKKNKFPLPPSPPPQISLSSRKTKSIHGNYPHQPHLDHSTSQKLMNYFQQEFICSFCEQLIVGATTLDCGCEKATVCLSCIEQHHSEDNGNKSDHSERDIIDDYVMVSLVPDNDFREGEKEFKQYLSPSLKGGSRYHEQPSTSTNSCESKTCPSCHALYDCHLPCHALDVAILDAVKNLQMTLSKEVERTNDILYSNNEDIKTFQSIFYMRLLLWRQEVIRRQAALLREYDHKQQLLLSRLIQREERAFSSKKCKGLEEAERKKRERRNNVFVEISIFAVFAFFGIAIRRR